MQWRSASSGGWNPGNIPKCMQADEHHPEAAGVKGEPGAPERPAPGEPGPWEGEGARASAARGVKRRAEEDPRPNRMRLKIAKSPQKARYTS